MLPMQSLHITPKEMSLILAHGYVYLIQFHMMMFVSYAVYLQHIILSVNKDRYLMTFSIF